jgi:hypothetical protein
MNEDPPTGRGSDPDSTDLLPPLRRERILTGLTGEETSRRFEAPPQPAPPPDPATRVLVKRTYELEEAVVHAIRRQAIVLGVNANDLANALLRHGLAELQRGALEARVGIVPEEQVRSARAAGRYIEQLQRREPGGGEMPASTGHEGG